MDTSLKYAKKKDQKDVLSEYRKAFHKPKTQGKKCIYFCGNSLGLMPKNVGKYIDQELLDWKNLGVEGHFHAKNPWMPYHEFLTNKMASLVGAIPEEVVVMNSLTVNLHLMMVSFYRPTKKRYKILVEYSPFPSDRYAIASQMALHGIDPHRGLIELKPDQGELVSKQRIEEVLEKHGHEIALILIGGVNYYTGQLYDIASITKLGHRHGCKVGFDLAHAAGNVALKLHNDGPDFAVWCTYKYLNSGPGSLSACFVHQRHHQQKDIIRFAGWWGQNKETRFLMGDQFDPIKTAEGWQLSNPPIFQMAAIRASLDIFEKAGIENLVQKSRELTSYLEFLVTSISNDLVQIITPLTLEDRGCQLSIQMKKPDKSLFYYLSDHGVVADWREPDVIRVAPVPLYNTFKEVWKFYKILKKGLKVLDQSNE